MPMSREIARAFMFGVVPHGGNFPEPKREQAEMTDADRAKIRELFTPEDSAE